MSATTQTENFNGWTTQETWAVNLFLGNDQPAYEGATRYTDRCAERGRKPSYGRLIAAAGYSLTNYVPGERFRFNSSKINRAELIEAWAD